MSFIASMHTKNSKIKPRLVNDLESHKDKDLELTTRINQLNFTKARQNYTQDV
jgi:hypothetical protein